MKTINNISDLTDKIDNNQPFAFSRWGDGEWLNVNKHKGSNCDGNVYYEDLGDALLEIASTKQNYHMGMQTLITWSSQQANKYDQNWGDADVMHRASMQNELQPFIKSLTSAHIVYIGNESLKSLPFINEFIEIPYTNIWNDRKTLISRITETFDDNICKVYCFSAGMATNVFIDQLWKLNNNNTYIDVGSVFDPYVGRITRSYHRKLQLT